ncbi:MAG: FlgD immunoglobulin-like domain containing protein [Chthonomonadales bacterium]
MWWKRLAADWLRRCLPGIVVVLAGAVVAPASAQTWGAPPLENNYLQATMGWKDQLNGENIAGRIILIDLTATGATGGVVPDYLLLPPYKTDVGINTMGSYVTVRIDGGWPKLPTGGVDTSGTRGGWDLIFGDKGVFGKTDESDWTRPPFLNGDKMIAQWETLPGGVATNPIPRIRVDSEMALIHDMLRLKLTVTNLDTRMHTVGIRWAHSYQLPGQDPNAFAWGPVFLSDGRAVSTDFDVSGPNVPAGWRQVKPNNNNSVGAVNIPLNRGVGFIAPDRWVIGYGNTIADDIAQNDLWEKIPAPLPNYDFSQPNSVVTAAAVYFNPRQFLPGEAKTFVMYFGRNHGDIDFEFPMAAGVDGPLTLDYNPSAAPGQQLTPNPFKVTAFVQNQASLALSSVSAVLSLPPGLVLKAGDTAKKTAGTVAPGQEASFSWDVVPDGTASGTLTYSVAFSASPGSLGKVVARQILVPALPVQTLPGGLQMVSFPYTFDDPTPTSALGLPDTDFALLSWDGQMGSYAAVPLIQPGVGYWLNLASGRTISLQNSHPVTAGQTELKLNQGWNLIGNPYLIKAYSSNVAVVNSDPSDPDFLKPLTVAQAADVNHQWLSQVLWTYDPQQQQYVPDLDFSKGLAPFASYWIFAYKPRISLLITKPAQARSVAVSPAKSRSAAAAGWTLQIVASGNGAVDRWNTIGVASGASDGLNAMDYPKPPAVQGKLSAALVRNGSGTSRAVSLAQDIRSASMTRKTWTLVVTAPKPGADITVSWPGIAAVPRSYELFITDAATGERRSMRQTSSMHVNLGSGTSRAFQITAEPRGTGALRITGLTVVSHRGGNAATIAFGTTQDATVQVRILGATGTTVRNLLSRASGAGQTQVTWDLRDAKGIAVPAGTYLVEVKATASDGSQARVVVPHLVTR